MACIPPPPKKKGKKYLYLRDQTILISSSRKPFKQKCPPPSPSPKDILLPIAQILNIAMSRPLAKTGTTTVCATTQSRTFLGTHRCSSSSPPSYYNFKISFWLATPDPCPWPGIVVQFDFLWFRVYSYDSSPVFWFSLNCDMDMFLLFLWILYVWPHFGLFFFHVCNFQYNFYYYFN
jgi:hypothetical protein